MKKINYGGSSKILNGIVTKINGIIDKLVVDVKVNGTSVVVVNQDGEREADIDLSVSDQNVKQSPTTDNADYRILLSKSANDTEETDISRKNTNFKYNPSTGNLQVAKVNGNTVPSGSGNDTLAKTSDIPTQASDIGAIPITEKGANNGVATLDASGKVPSSQIPGSVDEIIEGYYYNGSFYEDSAHTTLITPASGKIYVDLDSNKTYRWGGSVYVEISESLALGETQGTAYEGSKGKNLADRLDALATVATSGSYNDLSNKPTIPDELADLTDDSTHRLVTDTEKSTWNDKRAVNLELTNEDLNDVKTVGFYVGKNGNTCTNKPSGVMQFGLFVIRTATSLTGNYYKQTLIRPNASGETWSRSCVNGTWSAWNQEIFTDENVKQSPLGSTNSDYPLLLAYSANGTEETKAVWKDTNITYNPSTQKLTVLQAEFGTLQATAYDIGLGNNIKASIHHNALAESTVDSYLPIESGELALEEWQNRIGSMNLLPQKTTHKSGRVSANATFTVNEDGTITVDRTSPTSVDATFELSQRVINGGLWLPNGTYYMSGCPSGGSSSNYYLGVRRTKNGAQDTLGDDFGSGATFTINGDDFSSDGAWLRVVIAIKGNKAVSNQLWKPMITLTSLSNRKTYYPPSMSNRQLTFEKMDSVNVATIENTDNASKAYTVNDYMVLRGQLYRVTQAISNGGAITIGTNVTATTVGAELKAIRNALNL